MRFLYLKDEFAIEGYTNWSQWMIGFNWIKLGAPITFSSKHNDELQINLFFGPFVIGLAFGVS